MMYPQYLFHRQTPSNVTARSQWNSRCERSKAEKGNNAGNQSKRLKSRRQAENTDTDFDGNQNHTRSPTPQRPVLITQTLWLPWVLIRASKAIARPPSRDVRILSILLIVRRLLRSSIWGSVARGRRPLLLLLKGVLEAHDVLSTSTKARRVQCQTVVQGG